ncbi:hypothetical protein FB461_0810 [Rarobacter faecitabidus]|uniref:Uncharacterized protein n=1 Tax=Rarobacter faecitabidus TaxID=13243 RepID=A0A542ZVE4_RARFA|nr:hypothetical protein FB461_0810 [Rarobacter faecitabidus]
MIRRTFHDRLLVTGEDIPTDAQFALLREKTAGYSSSIARAAIASPTLNA